MNIISLREKPEYLEVMTEYIQGIWANDNNMLVYEDCLKYSLTSNNGLPQWYVVMDKKKIVGCAGLITNDFISRMDLCPWICAVFVEQAYRGKELGSRLLDKACLDAKNAGFNTVYLCTDNIGYYEKYGFKYIGDGYHPWGEVSRIYQKSI